VIGARMTRCTWDDIADAAGITREHAFARWSRQIARYETAGLLDPEPRTAPAPSDPPGAPSTP